MSALDEVPPWHAWCGCYGCRRGDAIARKALSASEANPQGPQSPEEGEEQ